MICRLCLIELQEEEYMVHLYDNEGLIIEANLVKIISNYFPQLQLTPDDPISTKVCEECSEHLEDFHRFYLLVEQKQKTLSGYQFLEVKCEQFVATPQPPSLPLVEEQFMNFCANNEEPVFAVPATEAVCDSGDIIVSQREQYTAIQCHIPPPPLEVPPKECNPSIDDDERPLIHCLKTKAKRKCTKKTKVRENAKTVKTPTAGGEKRKRNAAIIADFMPQLVCDLCKLAVANFTVLRAHFDVAHRQVACYVRCCGAKFDKPSSFVDHIAWHKNPNIFTCDLCQKHFRKRKCLQVHKQLRHTTRDEEEEANIACSKCGKLFRGAKCLANHMKRHLLNDGKDFPCKQCDKIFATAHRLRNHTEAIHDNIHPYVCDTCGKKFKFKPSFELHIQQHAGIVEPPQQCHICGEWLKNKNVLRLHHFRHDNSNCKCTHCGRLCPTRTALRGHIRYAHRLQNNHTCSYCGKTFKVAKNLQEHIAIHTGAQLYACPHCARECRSKSNMYVHIKRAHPSEWLQSKRARSNNPNHTAPPTPNGDCGDGGHN